MAEAQYANNHVIDPETGFLENPAYAYDFNAERKVQFLKVFSNNGLGMYRTCKALGLSPATVNKHYQIDSVFKKALDTARMVYADELEAVSRENALNPRSVIERIFQLKSLLPEKYGEQRNSGSLSVVINFDGKLVELAKKRDQILDVEPITGTNDLATGSTVLSDRNNDNVSTQGQSVE